MDSKRTHHQTTSKDNYKGDLDTHAAHYISVKERTYYNLPNSNDSAKNYRQANAYTNQSVHTRIDNHYLNQSPNHSYETMSNYGESGTASYISPEEEARRVQAKIDVAKDQGDMDNKRFRSHLKKAAEANDLDLRQFNGYKK
jgi:hypothetical protein